MKIKSEYMKIERRSYFNKGLGRKDNLKVKRKCNNKLGEGYRLQRMKYVKLWTAWEKIRHNQLME